MDKEREVILNKKIKKPVIIKTSIKFGLTEWIKEIFKKDK